MSLIVLVFWAGLTLSFYVQYIELRSGPKVHWQHEFHVDQVWSEGLSPQNQWIPLFLIELGILGMSNSTYQIISTYHNRQSLKIRRWVSPGGLREPMAEFSRCLAGNPSQPDHTVASHLRRRPKLQADSASCPKDILRICRLDFRSIGASSDCTDCTCEMSETSKAAATASYILHRKVSLKL